MSICKHKSNDGLCLLHSEPLYKEPCHEGPCHDYTAMTNADRIRAMSDDVDLALFLDDVRNDGFFKGQKYPYSKFGWLDWLKQEVNDGN
ncbi:MAG: hypothetical protein IJM90_04595 [Firmicutes bacterium]|nr:hypothetical protein [Bacillota bacterium]